MKPDREPKSRFIPPPEKWNGADDIREPVVPEPAPVDTHSETETVLDGAAETKEKSTLKGLFERKSLPDSLMLSKRLPRKYYIAVSTFIILALFSVMLQIVLLEGRTTPFMRFAGVTMGLQDRRMVLKKLNEMSDNAKLTIKTKTKSYTVNYDEIGMQLDTEEMARKATTNQMWQRFIPFYGLFGANGGSLHQEVIVDDEKLKLFTSTVAEEDKKPPTNASIEISNGKANLKPAAAGYEYKPEKIVGELKEKPLVNGAVIAIEPDVTKPARNDKDVLPLIEKAEKVLAGKEITIKADGKQFAVSPQTYGQWLVANENDMQQLELAIDQEKAKNYVNEINKSLFKAPGKTVVTLLDGSEVNRIAGDNGQGIDVNATIAALSGAILNGTTDVVVAPITILPPKVEEQRTYSDTQQGLEVLLADLVKEKGNYAISVQELSGKKRIANANGTKRFVAASTYKVFVAYKTILQVEANQWKWEDTLSNGRSINECFELMILKSDNVCAEALGDKAGWGAVEDSMRAIGIGSSGFDNSGAYAVANDETYFLAKLMTENLMSDAHREKLLDVMRRQVYRAGIPKGTGVTVADKVGFLDGYLNDTAVVYGPKGTYVLTILTKGSSWAEIADTSKRIHSYLQR